MPIKSFGSVATRSGLVVADDGLTNLHAFGVRMGKPVWTVAAPRPLEGGGTAPKSTPLQDLHITRGLVVGATYDDIRAWDARTGRLHWQLDATDPGGPLSATGDVAVYNARTGIDGSMRGVNTSTGKAVWSHRKLGLALRQEGGLIFTSGALPDRRGISVVEALSGRRVTARYKFPAFKDVQHLI